MAQRRLAEHAVAHCLCSKRKRMSATGRTPGHELLNCYQPPGQVVAEAVLFFPEQSKRKTTPRNTQLTSYRAESFPQFMHEEIII